MFLFLGFGMWFWVLIAVEFCLLTWFVEKCWTFASILSLAAFLALLWWLADVPVLDWIKNNPWLLLKYCIYYVIAGIIWSVGKYYFLLSRMRKKIKIWKKEWQEAKDKFKEKNIVNFEQYVKYKGYSYSMDFDNTAKRLVFWAMFWPTSFIWTILNEPVKRFFKFLIHDVFIGVYRKMHKLMITDLIES